LRGGGSGDEQDLDWEMPEWQADSSEDSSADEVCTEDIGDDSDEEEEQAGEEAGEEGVPGESEQERVARVDREKVARNVFAGAQPFIIFNPSLVVYDI